jgi:hypothetical protein
MKDEAEQSQENRPELAQIAEAIRTACLQAAQQGYQRAAADGLCDEGALEVALDAIRSLDLKQILRELQRADDNEGTAHV